MAYAYILLCSWKGLSGPNDMVQDDLAIVPRVPMGVSGTALAASLLRDGWSVSFSI